MLWDKRRSYLEEIMSNTETMTETSADQQQGISWKALLGEEKQKTYFKQILEFLASERNKGKTIYPQQTDIFNAIKFTPFNKVKVVIIGQDPYHGPNQAYGLCFSVRPGVPAPPSLKNIYKELQDDIGFNIPNHGCLEHWAKQGVLLLNTVLTVEAGNAHSHARIGWEIFTDKIIDVLNENKEGVVYLLWGSHAQRKGQMLHPTKQFILNSPHPSPLSAHKGFLGCKHFSKCNTLLERQGVAPIDWQI